MKIPCTFHPNTIKGFRTGQFLTEGYLLSPLRLPLSINPVSFLIDSGASLNILRKRDLYASMNLLDYKNLGIYEAFGIGGRVKYQIYLIPFQFKGYDKVFEIPFSIILSDDNPDNEIDSPMNLIGLHGLLSETKRIHLIRKPKQINPLIEFSQS